MKFWPSSLLFGIVAVSSSSQFPKYELSDGRRRRSLRRILNERARMLFTKIELEGAFLIDPEQIQDERGFFARTWCWKEVVDRGLSPQVVQCSISFNLRKGTLRGMHYQVAPHAETKVVRCTMGAIYDVIIDLRPDSPTFKRWAAFELTARNHRMAYISEGFAHGFQTLEDNTEVFYQMSGFYAPESARGVRWNDPVFGIQWPLGDQILSPQDQQYPDYCG